MNGDGITPAYVSNSSNGAFADLGYLLPGDSDLAAILGINPSLTHDACVLEFDFVPLGDNIKFKYVFSSEEYPEFACSQFNDAFAFFISGPGISGLQNIAIIPGTNAPVTITNINDVINCNSPYPQYYVSNKTNTLFTHNGHTKVFTASSQVQPCQTYHLKLVIADVFDDGYDSGVFLESGSLSSNTISIIDSTQTDQNNNNYLVEGCNTGSFKIKRPYASGSPLNVSLTYAGTATNGVDIQLLPSTVTIPANQTEVVVNVVPIIDNIPEGIETIKIYALAGGGCSATTATDSTIIQIRDYDTLGIMPDTVIICKNISVQLTASAGYTIYQWDANPTLSNPVIRNPMATPTDAATTYYCTATQGTCQGRDSSFVQLKKLDLISKTEINCKNGADGEIRVSGGAAWARPAEYSMNNGAWQADSTFSNLPVGVYTIRMRDGTGCIDSLVIDITQLYPDLVITGIPITAATCSGNADGVVTVNVTGGNNPYLFSTDGINFQSGNLFNLSQGNYTVTVKDNNSCSLQQNIIVPFYNTVTLDAGSDKTICESKSARIDALSNADTFVWTPAATLDNGTILNPVASPVQTTEYHVTATTGICTQKDTVIIFVNPAPVANAGPDQTICYGQNVKLSGSGGIDYTWHPSAFLDDYRSASPTAARLPGSTVYFVSVVDANGCRSLKNDTVSVTVTRPAVVNAGRDTTLAIGQALPLFATDVNHIGFMQYEWNPHEGLSDPFIANPVALAEKNIFYSITARNAMGCTATDYLKITVYKGPEIYVPNAFSPNADQRNDKLHITLAGIREFHYFRVYDRWGAAVFVTTDASKEWDGRIKGVEQPVSTYVWIAEGVDYKGNIIRRKGTVTIVK